MGDTVVSTPSSGWVRLPSENNHIGDTKKREAPYPEPLGANIIYCPILYYTLLYSTHTLLILYYTLLYYTILYHTILYYTLLYSTLLYSYYTILH